MLEQGPDFWCWFDTTQFSYIPLCSPNTCKYVFNPNVTTFQSNCAEGLHFSAFIIIESVDSISRDERDAPLTQYITNAGISRARYTIVHFKHYHRVLRLICNRMSV